MFGSHDDEALKREVAGWKDDRFFTQAGKVYSYSNPGYWLAGLLAETIGGKPYADQVATTIFEPLGMTHSTFRPTIALTFPLAQGHDVFAGKQEIIRPAADNAASWPAGSRGSWRIGWPGCSSHSSRSRCSSWWTAGPRRGGRCGARPRSQARSADT